MESMDILEQLRKQDRLLSESAVMKSVQKAIIEMGYEPFEEKVMGIYTAIDNTPTAYDVEKVVAELEEKEKCCHERALAELMENGHTLDAEGFLSQEDAYGKAVSVVKRGGAV